MSFSLGGKTIKRLCLEQKPMAWQQAKLSPALFRPYEQSMFEWVSTHVKQHHVLPQVETLHAQFPDTVALDTPEPSSYYVQLLQNQYFYERLNKANLDSQAALKADQDAHHKAVEILQGALRDITQQKYRLRILDVVKEAGKLVLTAYHNVANLENVGKFGWPYMDQQSGGIMPGDVISIVGRPAVGKTWLTLWMAIHNWKVQQLNTLFVSMEMETLPIAQRITAMYTKQPVHQLKVGGFSSQTLQKFYLGLKTLATEQAKFYVIDGSLAANVEEVFALAEMLDCKMVVIDGAYLMRHPNKRLDRFQRVAENVEAVKRYCGDLNLSSVNSWQFNREASKKQKKGGSDHGDLEDIGYSDAIAQISSIAISLFQEDSVETMKERKVRVMKGRNGEVGQFSIAWDFLTMDFSQSNPPTQTAQQSELKELQYL